MGLALIGRKGEKFMLKSELLERLKDIADDADINETILSIEDFAKSSKFDTNKLTIEDFKNVLANNKEIKAYYTSALDSGISKAVNSHDEKFKKEKLPLLVDAEIKKRSNEGKSETEIQLQEMKEQLEKMKAEKLKADMSAKYTKVLSEKGLSTELIDFVLGADDETTTANIDKINSIIGNVANSRVKEKIGESSYKQEGISNSNVGKITWEQVVENPKLYSDYMSQNKE